ncbi:hypothetical protein [Streptosporangium carneum]|uniref:Molecular chaperone n=1 Tax=Streptosporangium carneum TaxID=47481 RepID=A0A9W6MFJ6_9ACTN|nr:hypothetical protein [Streptosporangium carneum]GLK12192.1 hypothetical protein GCM10017600_56010 [Streptosporangium carneum]
MTVRLLFAGPQDGESEETAPGVFVIFEVNGEYRLPDVFVEPDGVAHAVDVQGPGPQPPGDEVAAEVAKLYALPGWRPRPVPGRYLLVQGPSVPVTALGFGGERVVRMAWWLGAAGSPPQEFSLELRFMPPGARPAQGAGGNKDAARRVEPIGEPRRHERFFGHAAIDFGTSSSTVTLYDRTGGQRLEMDEQQFEVLLEGFHRLLLNGPEGPHEADWPQVRHDIVQGFAARLNSLLGFSGTGDSVQVTVKEDGVEVLHPGFHYLPVAPVRYRDVLCRELDLAISQMDEKLGTAYATSLDRCYADAFGTPALSSLYLYQVVFDGDSPEISSEIKVLEGSPLRAVLGDGADRVVRGYPGLKRAFSRPRELPELPVEGGRPMTTDMLLMHAYNDLVDKTIEHGNEKRSAEWGIRGLKHLVLTYPTTLPPSGRRALEKMAQSSLRMTKVTTTFDEAVAAALFFVMRDFGGESDTGIEPFRARSRRVRQGRPAWRQNMLVIDIGGGTTDVALFALHLLDQRVPAHEVTEEFFGRHYVIRPEVRGSTGHPQLGGDLLTLRVFHWLKAEIADALMALGAADKEDAWLRHWPPSHVDVNGTPRPIAPAFIANPDPGPRPGQVWEALRDLLPTHSPALGAAGERAAPGRAFFRLWQEAEQAKRLLGAGREYTLPKTKLQEVLNNIDGRSRPPAALVDRLGHTVVTLVPEQFEHLATPVITAAVDIALTTFSAQRRREPDEPIDIVALSGKTSTMPLVERIVARRLRELTVDGVGAGPTPRLVVERRYAKQATSIGACWAHSFSRYADIESQGAGSGRKAAAEQHDDSGRRLRAGQNVVGIAVDNLLQSLPCDFSLQNTDTRVEMLLNAGDRLDIADRTGRLSVRTAWRSMKKDIQIHRELGGDRGESIEWGRFTFDSNEDRLTRANVDWGRIRFQIEINQELEPVIHLCQEGNPIYLLDGGSGDVGTVLEGGRSGTRLEVTGLPAAIHVRRTPDALDDRETVELFPILAPGEDTRRHLRSDLLESGGDGRVFAGAIAPGWLPSPVEEHGAATWDFVWVDAYGNVSPLFRRSAPRRDSHVRYHVTLDYLGRLRINVGHPRYLPARRLTDLADYPGSVFTAAMEPGDPFGKPEWEPFTGDH